MANIAGIRRIKITGKVIMLTGITFAVLTWVLLYGRAGGIGGLIMFLGALSYPVAFGGLVWAAGWICRRLLSAGGVVPPSPNCVPTELAQTRIVSFRSQAVGLWMRAKDAEELPSVGVSPANRLSCVISQFFNPYYRLGVGQIGAQP